MLISDKLFYNFSNKLLLLLCLFSLLSVQLRRKMPIVCFLVLIKLLQKESVTKDYFNSCESGPELRNSDCLLFRVDLNENWVRLEARFTKQ